MHHLRRPLLPVLALLLAAGCTSRRGGQEADKVAPAVAVITVGRATVTRTVQLLGTLQGEEQATLSSRIAGRVTEITRPEGTTVAAGDPILYVVNDIPGMDYKPGPVTAPFAGIVGRVNVEVGQTVAPGMPVATVSSFAGRIRARAAVSDADLPFVGRGARARVTASALPDSVFTGTVSQVSPMLDPASRTATVEVQLANPRRLLVPGMSVSVRLTVEEKPDVIALPLAALNVGGAPRAVVIEGTTARIRDIRTGLVGDELVEVVSGLSAGDRIATIGKERVKDGETVRPVEAGTQ
jgi:multidrug efflux pump subunit AcrA (membrane-fusion protein)